MVRAGSLNLALCRAKSLLWLGVLRLRVVVWRIALRALRLHEQRLFNIIGEEKKLTDVASRQLA
jgi:hypothetical protein